MSINTNKTNLHPRSGKAKRTLCVAAVVALAAACTAQSDEPVPVASNIGYSSPPAMVRQSDQASLVGPTGYVDPTGQTGAQDATDASGPVGATGLAGYDGPVGIARAMVKIW